MENRQRVIYDIGRTRLLRLLIDNICDIRKEVTDGLLEENRGRKKIIGYLFDLQYLDLSEKDLFIIYGGKWRDGSKLESFF